MTKDPAFLFYPSDFLTGVTDLTMEERGQYITMLCLQHQKGVLTEKTIRLSVGSVSVDVLSKFSHNESGEYFNDRLTIEIEKRSKFVDSRKENGKKGGRPKKASAKPNGKPNGKPKKNLPEDVNESEVINSNIPDWNTFLTYAKTLPIYKLGLDYSLRAKYNSWVSDGWKDGNGNKIIQWKTKLQNTMPYLKEVSAQQSRNNPPKGY